MRVVVDTNVIVSALLSPQGSPAQILANESGFQMFTSEEILAEVRRVLHYDRIQTRYQLDEELINGYLEQIRASSHVIPVNQDIDAVAADPDDNMFLACAVEAGADAIVSGDSHLRQLESYRGIVIMTPSEFLAFLNTL